MEKQFLAEKLKGFGSSDAKAVLHFATTGSISNVLHRRISEIKGEIPRPKEINSKFLDTGNNVEEMYNAYLQKKKPTNLLWNPKNDLKNSPYKNFTVTNHIDFEQLINGHLEWIELKSVKDDFETTEIKYFPQNGWHLMILKSINKNSELSLAVYDTSSFYQNPEGHKFDISLMTKRRLNMDDYKITIEALESGLKELDEIWDTIPAYEEKETLELTKDEVMQVEAMISMNEVLQELKCLDEKKKSIQDLLKQNMEDRGIKSIKTPFFTISYKDEHTRQALDTKKIKKILPDWSENYSKTSVIKPSVSIKLNEPKKQIA